LHAANGSCFFFFGTRRTWADASAACTAMGAHLAVLDDAAENQTARSADPTIEQCWIGYTDQASEAGTNGRLFARVTGGTIGNGYANFDTGEPNDSGSLGRDADCVQFQGSNEGLVWSDKNCAETKAYLCERER
jgi:hypothetical protein